MTELLTEQQWAEARAAAMAAIPAEVKASGLPSVLLPYQAKTVRLLDGGSQLCYIEKSRRIGLTCPMSLPRRSSCCSARPSLPTS